MCSRMNMPWGEIQLNNSIYLFHGASRKRLQCGAGKLFCTAPDNTQLQINAEKLEVLTMESKIVILIFNFSWDMPAGKTSVPFFFLTSVNNLEMQQRKSLLAVEVACSCCRSCCWGLVRNCYVYKTQVLFLPYVFRTMVTLQNVLQSILCPS